MSTYKNITGERTTITRDTVNLEETTDNIYEAIVVLSKRANQISVQMKEELQQKLSEFASHSDNLEEIFENREQIEISKHYERLPKPPAIAIDELLGDKIVFRSPDAEEDKTD